MLSCPTPGRIMKSYTTFGVVAVLAIGFCQSSVSQIYTLAMLSLPGGCFSSFNFRPRQTISPPSSISTTILRVGRTITKACSPSLWPPNHPRRICSGLRYTSGDSADKRYERGSVQYANHRWIPSLSIAARRLLQRERFPGGAADERESRVYPLRVMGCGEGNISPVKRGRNHL